MLRSAILAIPMMFAWIVITSQFTFAGMIVGYIFGLAILLLLRSNTRFDADGRSIVLTQIPYRLAALVIYCIRLTIELVVSGADVARRVMLPKMDVNPGIYCIPTHDEGKSTVVAALSAHSITITPGELVIDFDTCGEDTLLVHVLDKEASTPEKLSQDQVKRVQRIRAFLGYD